MDIDGLLLTDEELVGLLVQNPEFSQWLLKDENKKERDKQLSLERKVCEAQRDKVRHAVATLLDSRKHTIRFYGGYAVELVSDLRSLIDWPEATEKEA